MISTHPYLKDKKIIVEAAPSGERFNGLLTKDSYNSKKDKPFLYLGYNNIRGFDMPISVLNRGLVTLKGKVIIDRKIKNPCPDFEGEELTELEWFEKTLNRNLNPFMPAETNWWRTGDRKLRNVEIVEGRLELDLNNPLDLLKYKILLANEDVIAENKEVAKKFNTGRWDFIMRDAQTVENETAEEALLEANAFDLFNKLKDSKEEMIKALSVIYNKEIRPSTDIKAVTVLLNQEMKKDYKFFIEGMKDPHYDMKFLIRRLLSNRLIEYNHTYNKYSIEGEVIGNLNDMISYLVNPVNSETLINLETRLKMSEK